jgi:hypothetical protein
MRRSRFGDPSRYCGDGHIRLSGDFFHIALHGVYTGLLHSRLIFQTPARFMANRSGELRFFTSPTARLSTFDIC